MARERELAARKIIRKPQVRELTGFSDTTIWRLEKQGRFPRRVRLGEISVDLAK
jgi:predicted DNA-binding transcriptional regulator AlpA